MEQSKVAEKEFSEWAKVAEGEPASFEALRQAAIAAYIESVPEKNRERLLRLQWRIDQERNLAQTPMSACMRLSRMMWNNMVGEKGLRDHLEHLGGLLGGQADVSRRQIEGAKVLAFVRDSAE